MPPSMRSRPLSSGIGARSTGSRAEALIASTTGPRRCTCRWRVTRSVLTQCIWRGMPSITESPNARTKPSRIRRPLAIECVGSVQSLKGR